MRKFLIACFLSGLVTFAIHIQAIRNEAAKDEREYRYGCADAWLDKNGRGHKKLHWMPYSS